MTHRKLKRDALARLVALSSERAPLTPEPAPAATTAGRWLEGGGWTSEPDEPQHEPAQTTQR
jgi:hypothetical protein